MSSQCGLTRMRTSSAMCAREDRRVSITMLEAWVSVYADYAEDRDQSKVRLWLESLIREDDRLTTDKKTD